MASSPSWRDGRTTAQRGYGERWRKARREYLREHYWCVMCAAAGKPKIVANVVDHVHPHRGDWSVFWDRSNWQALCTTCHSTRKAQLERGGRMRGHGEDGMPLDPGHHWRSHE